jgi:hypothetical protein
MEPWAISAERPMFSSGSTHATVAAMELPIAEDHGETATIILYARWIPLDFNDNANLQAHERDRVKLDWMVDTGAESEITNRDLPNVASFSHRNTSQLRESIVIPIRPGYIFLGYWDSIDPRPTVGLQFFDRQGQRTSYFNTHLWIMTEEHLNEGKPTLYARWAVNVELHYTNVHQGVLGTWYGSNADGVRFLELQIGTDMLERSDPSFKGERIYHEILSPLHHQFRFLGWANSRAEANTGNISVHAIQAVARVPLAGPGFDLDGVMAHRYYAVWENNFPIPSNNGWNILRLNFMGGSGDNALGINITTFYDRNNEASMLLPLHGFMNLENVRRALFGSQWEDFTFGGWFLSPDDFFGGNSHTRVPPAQAGPINFYAFWVPVTT